jgi:hypothetical protein
MTPPTFTARPLTEGELTDMRHHGKPPLCVVCGVSTLDLDVEGRCRECFRVLVLLPFVLVSGRGDTVVIKPKP